MIDENTAKFSGRRYALYLTCALLTVLIVPTPTQNLLSMNVSTSASPQLRLIPRRGLVGETFFPPGYSQLCRSFLWITRQQLNRRIRRLPIIQMCFPLVVDRLSIYGRLREVTLFFNGNTTVISSIVFPRINIRLLPLKLKQLDNQKPYLIYLTDLSETRLYVIRNEEPGEACLNQVKAK